MKIHRGVLSLAVAVVMIASAISVMDYSVNVAPTSSTSPMVVALPPFKSNNPPSPVNIQYNVSFNETGLPTGAVWAVNISGVNYATHNSTLQLTMPQGDYNYTVSNSLDFYTQSPAGQFAVVNHDVSILVKFGGQLTVTGYINLYTEKLVNSTSLLTTNQSVFPVYGVFDNYSHNTVVVGYYNSMVYEINQYNQSIITSFKGPTSPIAVDYNHQNGELYVLNSTTVFAYSSTGSLLTSNYLGNYLIALAYNPSNAQVIVGNMNGGLYFLNSGSLSVISVLPGVTVFGSQSFAYNSALNQMEVINDTSINGNIVYLDSGNSQVSQTNVTGTLMSMVYNPDTNSTYYVTLQGSQSYAYVLNSTGSHLIGNTSGSFGLGLLHDLNSILISNSQNGTLQFVNASTNEVVYTVQESGSPIMPISASGSNSVLVVNSMEDALDIVAPSNMVVKVNFFESGLKPSTPWNVTLNGVTLGTNGSSVQFYELPGAYNYNVSLVPGFIAQQSGTLVATGSEVNIYLAFVKSYALTFNEAGLTAGYNWTVNLNGNSVTADAGGHIIFSVPNGTFEFNVTTTANLFATPDSGYITVDGAAVTVTVNFAVGTYHITFVSSGLPALTPWQITINGIQEKTTGTTVTYSAVPGIYSYIINSVNGYYPQVSTGSVQVTDSNVTVQIDWLPFLYNVNFNESGLPSATLWNITIGNTAFTGTSGTNISVNLQNGTYDFTYATANDSWRGGSGSFIVAGSKLIINVTFTPVLYKVSFKESGLPTGTYWSVMVGSHSSVATYGNLSILHFQNGTYTFTAESSNSSFSAYSGQFTVDGSDIVVNIIFELHQYNVTFVETGLSSGTSWGVYVAGVGYFNTSHSQVYAVLPVGQHSYSPLPVAGYNSSQGGYFEVTANMTISVVYTPLPSPTSLYNVTFFELGLPEQFTWIVTLNGTSQESHAGGIINFQLPNGTYNLSIYSKNSDGKVFKNALKLPLKVKGHDQILYVLFYGPYPWIIFDFCLDHHHSRDRGNGDHNNNDITGFTVARDMIAVTVKY